MMALLIYHDGFIYAMKSDKILNLVLNVKMTGKINELMMLSMMMVVI